jgi:mono/diheme cytochrome c family protein
MVFRLIRSDHPLRALVLWMPALALIGVLAGCKTLPPSKLAAEFTPLEARGAQVFQASCARCHSPSSKGRRGPGLQALTKLKAMPSGAPPSDARITETILHGRGMMPAVPIEDEDLRALLAYLHTL